VGWCVVFVGSLVIWWGLYLVVLLGVGYRFVGGGDVWLFFVFGGMGWGFLCRGVVVGYGLIIVGGGWGDWWGGGLGWGLGLV
jgi:hypothetical protein